MCLLLHYELFKISHTNEPRGQSFPRINKGTVSKKLTEGLYMSNGTNFTLIADNDNSRNLRHWEIIWWHLLRRISLSDMWVYAAYNAQTWDKKKQFKM